MVCMKPHWRCGKYKETCIVRKQQAVRLQGRSEEYKGTCIIEVCHRNLPISWLEMHMLFAMYIHYVMQVAMCQWVTSCVFINVYFILFFIYMYISAIILLLFTHWL